MVQPARRQARRRPLPSPAGAAAFQELPRFFATITLPLVSRARQTSKKQTKAKGSVGTFDADKFHADSRARVAKLAAEGKSHVALAESLALLGIDINSGVKPRIVGCNGVRFRDPKGL